MKHKPDFIDREIGRRLRVARISANIRQYRAAKAVGVTYQQMRKYEVGYNRVSAVIVARLAHSLPASGRRVTTTRLLVMATAVLMSAVLLPIAVFSLLRISSDPKPANDKWPSPTVKVYDPYGDLERAGKPGPFYR